MNSIRHSGKIAFLFLITTLSVVAMEQREVNLLDLQLLLQEGGYTKEAIEQIKKEGLSAQDENLLITLRKEYQAKKEVLNEFGYDYAINKQGKYVPLWRILTRSESEKKYLVGLSFDAQDVEQLTIANVEKPFEDNRIRRASESTLQPFNRRTFAIFNSQLLWPLGLIPSEADILLLLPHLIRQDPTGVNTHLTRGSTLLGLAARAGYTRVVIRLLLLQNIQVNERVGDGLSPLEHAIEGGHGPIVLSLLNHQNIQISDHALHMVQRTWPEALWLRSEDQTKAAIRKWLQEHARNRSAARAAVSPAPSAAIQSAAVSGSAASLPIPKKDNLLLGWAKRKLHVKTPANTQDTPPSSSAQPWVTPRWMAAGGALVAATAYGVVQTIIAKKAQETPKTTTPEQKKKNLKVV
jgi:hypothetical protein